MKRTKKVLAVLVSILLILTMLPVVNINAASRVKLNKKNVTIRVGKTIRLKVKNNRKKVKWTTSNKKIATVSKKGLVKGKKAGKVVITAKIGKKKYKCRVKVVKKKKNKVETTAPTPETTKPVEKPTTKPTIEETTTSSSIVTGRCGIEAFYTFDNTTQVLRIYGSGEIYDYSFLGSYKAPWLCFEAGVKRVIIEEGITKIGEYAFHLCDTLEDVEIPNTVKTIGFSSFEECDKLVRLIIPEGVETIENEAFENSGVIGEVILPSTLKKLGNRAFYNCDGIKKIEIKEGLTYISNAFSDCTYLENVEISNSVTKIENDAFRNCVNLTKVVVPNSVTYIGSSVFENCIRLEDFSLSENLKYIGTKVLYNTPYYNDENNWENGVLYVDECLLEANVDKGFTTRCYTIKDGTKIIASDAFFDGASSLTNIEIPESVLYIGSFAFYNCINLESIHLPSELRHIGMCAFQYNKSLTELIIPDSVVEVEEYAFAECDGLEILQIPCSTKYYNNTFNKVNKLKNVHITKGNGIMNSYTEYTLISNMGYYQATPWYNSRDYVEELILDEGITNIGDEAFNGMLELTKIKIPSTVKTIGRNAFYACTSLEELVIPEGVERVEEGAFSYCDDLVTVTIPDSVTYLDINSFSESNNLKIIRTVNQYVIEVLGGQYEIVAP